MHDMEPPLLVRAWGFLWGCKGLTKVDLSPIGNVKKVGNHSLTSCYSLTRIDLAPLDAIDAIPDGFLHGCRGLTEVDLSPLVNVSEV